jgi:hypothetical protein
LGAVFQSGKTGRHLKLFVGQLGGDPFFFRRAVAPGKSLHPLAAILSPLMCLLERESQDDLQADPGEHELSINEIHRFQGVAPVLRVLISH